MEIMAIMVELVILTATMANMEIMAIMVELVILMVIVVGMDLMVDILVNFLI
jgi:hypothetical protein